MQKRIAIIGISLLAASSASAEPDPFCKALMGVKEQAFVSGSPQRIKVIGLNDGEIEIGCQWGRDDQVQKEFCHQAFKAVGIEFYHIYPWRVRKCLTDMGIQPGLEAVDEPTWLRKRKKITHLWAGWSDGTRLDISFVPSDTYFEGYYGTYSLVIWKP